MDNNKIQLISIGVPPKMEEEQVQIGEAAITVKHRIPYEEVLDMMQWCISFIINDRPFISEPLKQIIKDFAILKYYTDIDMSFVHDYQDMAEVYEAYDIIDSYNLMYFVRSHINGRQLEFFNTTLDKTLESIIKYQNSAKGVLDILAEDADKDVRRMQEAMDVIGDDEKNKKITTLLKFAEELQRT